MMAMVFTLVVLRKWPAPQVPPPCSCHGLALNAPTHRRGLLASRFMMFAISFSARCWQGFSLLSLLLLTATPSFAQRPLGTDVSGYQPNISWPFARNGGVTFGWAKATESTDYVNPEYTEQIAGAKTVGVYIGSYHFARPSQNPNITGANSAESEAQFF